MKLTRYETTHPGLNATNRQAKAPSRPGRWVSAGLRVFVPSLAVALFAGCESDSSGDTMTARQNAAMKDPFSYGPAEHSGKNVPQEPRKRDDSLKGEWERFWNP